LGLLSAVDCGHTSLGFAGYQPTFGSDSLLVFTF